MPVQTLKKIKFREAFQNLYRAEKEFGFYDLSYNGIPLWIYPRENASFFMNGVTSFPEQAFAFLRIRPINLLRRCARFFIGLNKIFGNDIIIFVNERHLQWSEKENNFYNQYAELVLEGGVYKKALIFEFPTSMTTKYKKTKYKKYLPLDLIIAIKRILSPCFLFFYPKINREFYQKIKKANLWQEKDIKKILRFSAMQAYGIKYYGIFLRLIKLLNPKAKLIYSCMAGYDKFPEVIEIQHGVIGDYHCQYIYPLVPQIKEYLQNKKIIVFSDKIKKLLTDNGYLAENVEVRPNPKIYFYFLKNVKKDFFKQVSEKKEIVIIGGFGGNIQETLKNFILNIEKNKEKFENWDVSIVLHPSEKNVYKNLRLKKVQVFENQEVSLWEMLCNAVCIASVCSTVMEEATYFGCFEIIIPNKDLEDQENAIEWLCGDYHYKTIVSSDDFPKWFKDNEEKIINHWKQKKEIMKKNYNYFQNYKKDEKNY